MKGGGEPAPNQAPNDSEDALDQLNQSNAVEHNVALEAEAQQSLKYDGQPESPALERPTKEQLKVITRQGSRGTTSNQTQDRKAIELLTPESDASASENLDRSAARLNERASEPSVDTQPVTHSSSPVELEQPSLAQETRSGPVNTNSSMEKTNGNSEVTEWPLYKVCGGRYIYVRGGKTTSLIRAKERKALAKGLTTLKSGSTGVFQIIPRDDFDLLEIAPHLYTSQEGVPTALTFVARMQPYKKEDIDTLRSREGFSGMIDGDGCLVFSKSTLGPGMKQRLIDKMGEQNAEVKLY